MTKVGSVNKSPKKIKTEKMKIIAGQVLTYNSKTIIKKTKPKTHYEKIKKPIRTK